MHVGTNSTFMATISGVTSWHAAQHYLAPGLKVYVVHLELNEAEGINVEDLIHRKQPNFVRCGNGHNLGV